MIPFLQNSRASRPSYDEKAIRTMFVSRGGCQGLPGKGHDRTFWSVGNVQCLDDSVGMQVCIFVKCDKIIHLSFMHSVYFIAKRHCKHILNPY